MAGAVTRAAGELGCAALPAVPYSPHQKGKIERLHRTIGDGLIARLPHYTGGPRQANGQLYAQAAPLSLAQLQTRVRDFIDAYNSEHPHRGIGGLTPAQKWDESAAPLELVEPDQLRWMLMADRTRVISKDGIRFEGVTFVAPEITARGGETVQVRHMPHDLRSIEIFDDAGWLCTAYAGRADPRTIRGRHRPAPRGRSRDGTTQSRRQPQGSRADRTAHRRWSDPRHHRRRRQTI